MYTVQVGVTASARPASPFNHAHPCASRVFLVRRAPPERRSMYAPPLVLADASRSAAGHFAAVNGPACRIYRELSNSHELSMLHPTRLSLSTSGATPQAAPGYRKLVEWYTSQVCVCELSWKCPPAVVLRGCAGCARLLTRGQAL